ncbi:MAG: peptide chain release factor N(5)-glutamine methyltransferase, partial [Desulfobacteraceae bacterium]|nr:peptide chain release factor N(5)-glutamine methyltransferase [Desulfobacteraceae bacterium]
VNAAHLYLCREGYLLLEIGHDQKDDVLKIIEQSGNYEKAIFTKDYSGYDRIVQMQKKET